MSILPHVFLYKLQSTVSGLRFKLYSILRYLWIQRENGIFCMRISSSHPQPPAWTKGTVSSWSSLGSLTTNVHGLWRRELTKHTHKEMTGSRVVCRVGAGICRIPSTQLNSNSQEKSYIIQNKCTKSWGHGMCLLSQETEIGQQAWG